MKTKGIRLTKDVLDAALAGGTILGGGGGGDPKKGRKYAEIAVDYLGKLFSSREFQALVRDTAEQQWMVKPGDLKEGDYVGRLYERLNSQMEKIESALKNAGQEHTAFSQMAGNRTRRSSKKL